MLFSFFQCKIYWGKPKIIPKFVRNAAGQWASLRATEKVTETSDVPDYNERITLLRYALERYTNFDSDEDIPEAVIEAFVEKIVVNENSFDWYLHFSGDDKTPKTCNVEGDKKAHKIEFFGVSYAPALVEGCSGCNRKQVI